MNVKTWDKLPKHIQDVFMEALRLGVIVIVILILMMLILMVLGTFMEQVSILYYSCPD
jgi:flagellar biosynthesis protein FliR